MDEILFYYKKCLSNYVNFEGRARRKEFWMFVLANVVVSIVLSMLGGIISSWISNILSMIYSFAILLPSIAVGVRRLHDLGKSGWLYLLILIPIVGAIILIYWSAQPGQTGENEYGLDPKQA